MTTRTTFGDQPTRTSAPSFGFGSSSREQAGKVFVSQEHTALATAGKGSPGPGANYQIPASIGGSQPDGRRKNPPSWSMGKNQRFTPKEEAKAPDGRRGNNPGPGHYTKPPPAVGPQTLARFKSSPMVGFGTAGRKEVRKVWISQEHQRTDMHGMGSPGPAAPYQLGSTCGKMVNSDMKNPPAWVFGSAKHAADRIAIGPGPAYSLPQSVGPQVDSRYPGAPTPGFGASTRDIRAKICARACPFSP